MATNKPMDKPMNRPMNKPMNRPMNKPLNKLMINLPAEPPLSSVGVVDSIDILGCTAPLGPFHIDGPYEATLLARNLDPRTSPVAALRESNAEALRATPRACIMDSLINHVPLQGTATIPSGCRDENGVVMHYEESTDMMHEDRTDGGPLRRWNHTTYDADNLNGKGDSSYSIEKAENARKEAMKRAMTRAKKAKKQQKQGFFKWLLGRRRLWF